MSVDFSNESIGKPRWCITRGGEAVYAYLDRSPETYVDPVVSVTINSLRRHYTDGRYLGSCADELDLVSFAPPECDSFLWKAPEPIKVGDWVEVISDQYRDVPVGTKTQVTSIDKDGDAWLSPSVSSKRQSSCWSPKWLRKCDPPSPTYRPFANAEEFRPHADRWITLVEGDVYMKVSDFSGTPDGIIVHVATFDKIINAKDFLDGFVFADTNEPCGVKVQ